MAFIWVELVSRNIELNAGTGIAGSSLVDEKNAINLDLFFWGLVGGETAAVLEISY